jgi:hypothetical protein
MMKTHLTLALALLLLVGCSKKDEAPATAAQPSSTPATAPADQTAAAQPPATAPAASTSPSRTTKATSVAGTSAHKSAAAAPAAPLVIPSGTALTVRTMSALGSEQSQTGDTFDASLAEPISVNGNVVAPKGADATGKVVEAQKKGKFKGEARLKLTLTSITIQGKKYPVSTTMTAQSSAGKGKRTAVTTGGGAGVGALIGGLAGGGKGAAIGALVGGGAGLAGGAMTGNKQIEIPAESALVFKLNEPVTIK